MIKFQAELKPPLFWAHGKQGYYLSVNFLHPIHCIGYTLNDAIQWLKEGFSPAIPLKYSDCYDSELGYIFFWDGGDAFQTFSPIGYGEFLEEFKHDY